MFWVTSVFVLLVSERMRTSIYASFSVFFPTIEYTVLHTQIRRPRSKRNYSNPGTRYLVLLVIAHLRRKSEESEEVGEEQPCDQSGMLRSQIQDAYAIRSHDYKFQDHWPQTRTACGYGGDGTDDY
jgi:hypothetical protein